MSLNQGRPRLVIAVNSPIALAYLQGQPQYFRDKGFDVAVLCPQRRKDEWEVTLPEGVLFIEVPMEREIAPWRDFVSLYRLWRAMHALRPAITNVGTPKAGLLAGLAAWLNGVPCRFYTLHGLRFETTTGLKRRLLVFAERLSCRFAHCVVCASDSVRQKAASAGLAAPERMVILGSGSCNGVDASRFAMTPQIMRQATQVRRQLEIPLSAPVLLFVGRLTRDKGIPELVQAFAKLLVRFAELRLLLVGCFEDGDPLPVDTRRCLETNPHVIFAGAVQDVVPYYAAADVLVLPSHREGLPTVVLEAQAVGVPVVGASATGTVDVIVDGETGLLFPVGDVAALADRVARLIADHRLANKLRVAGQEQVQNKFRQERIWEALHSEYLRFLQPKEQPRSSIPCARRSGRLATEPRE